MKLIFSLVIFSWGLFEARGYPYPVHTSSGNIDTWSYGDPVHGGRVLSTVHDPYNRRAVRSGPTTYSLRQPITDLLPHHSSQLHQADRRRQALLDVNDTPPQENEVPVQATEIIGPVEQAPVASTTVKAITPELSEPEIEEDTVPQTKKFTPKKKQDKRPVDEEDEDDVEEEGGYPDYRKFPTQAFFPMFFGWGTGNGPTAVATDIEGYGM